MNGGVSSHTNIGFHFGIRQGSDSVGSDIVNVGQDTVGYLSCLSQSVVATIECSAKTYTDAATRHLHLVAAVDGSHIATTKYIAVDSAATHTYRCQSYQLREGLELRDIV